MNNHSSPIVGSVFERKPGSNPRQPGGSRTTPGTASTGFPSVQHRSKSAFARNREDTLRKNVGSARSNAPPVPIPAASSSASQAAGRLTAPLSAPTAAPAHGSNDLDALRDQVSRENEARIAGMSAEEIEEERRQILERFGAGIGDVLAKAKQNRLKRASEATRSRSGTSTPLPPPVDIEESRKALQNLEEGQFSAVFVSDVY